MSKHPKIIILDNDETTGSYKLLFIIYEFLMQSAAGKHIQFHDVIHLIRSFYKHPKYSNEPHMIRPHVGMFLNQLIQLKKAGKIDHVVMLTNQHTSRPWTDSTGASWTVSEMIAALLFLEAGGNNTAQQTDQLWSAILTRDLAAPQVADTGYNIKYLTRVFTALGYSPEYWSYKNVWFVDDLAERPFAELWSPADLARKDLPASFADIPASKVFKRVPAYRIPVLPDNLSIILWNIIHIVSLKDSNYDKTADLKLANKIVQDIQKEHIAAATAAEMSYGKVIERNSDFESISFIESAANNTYNNDTTFVELSSQLKDTFNKNNNGTAAAKRSRPATPRKTNNGTQLTLDAFLKTPSKTSQRPRSSSQRRNHTPTKNS